MKKIFVIVVGLIASFGCARVSVVAPKEPIKVDISMRLDIYQHIQKDIDEIEGIVSGSQEKAKTSDKQSFLSSFVSSAYAQDALSPDVERAALRRKDRRDALYAAESRGLVGEDRMGFVQISSGGADASVQQLVNTENADRTVIYKGVAQKNGSSIEEVQKIYSKRMQKDAPSGTPIEVRNEDSGLYAWQVK